MPPTKQSRRRPGRPPKGEDVMEQIAIRFPKPMLVMIDAIIAGRLDGPDRSSVIRELVAQSLKPRSTKRPS